MKNKFEKGQTALVISDSAICPGFKLCKIYGVYPLDKEEFCYHKMCQGCDGESRCHNDCTTCEDYDEMLAELDKSGVDTYYTYSVNFNDVPYNVSVDESKLLPIVNEDSFCITPINDTDSPRKLASRILGQTELCGNFYYEIEDWLTDFLSGNERDLPVGMNDEYLKCALRIIIRNIFDELEIEDVSSEDIEYVLNTLFQYFPDRVVNEVAIKKIISSFKVSRKEGN